MKTFLGRALFFCFAIISLLHSIPALSQPTLLKGKITDALTNEPIPFVTVLLKKDGKGATTNFDGKFELPAPPVSDTIIFTLIGYQTVKMPVKGGQSQTFMMVLKATKVDLQEVTINAGENPANILLRKVQKNKSVNDPRRLETYIYEVYNKLEFDLTNINDKVKGNRLLKPFAFIWDNIDSTETNSIPFLPFFISETVSDVYFRTSPQGKREVIKASKVSGLENATVTQLLGDMYQRINLYENFIDLFGKGFVSPVSDIALTYYKYYLTDSSYIDNQWCYKLKFKPRRPQELTFTGDMWIHDSTFAIKKISLRIAEDANINFVEAMAIVQEYEYVEDKYWMLNRDMLVVDFAAREEGMGFIGRKTTSYKGIKVNVEVPDEIFKGNENIIVKEDALLKSSEFWTESRHDSLSEREQKIYHMVDTIKTLPAFKTYVDLITMFFTGYRDIGKIELGPYYTLYSFNQVEGNRFRVGGRTSDDLSTIIQFNGYVAYGTKDEKFKYMAGLRFKLSDKPRQFAGVSYKFDIQQLGQSDNAFQDDNILSSFFRRNPANKLNSIEQERAYYEIEWFPGLSNRITASHALFIPLGELDISYYANDAKTEIKNSLNVTDINFNFRYAHQEKFVSGKVDRVSLGSEFPIFQANITLGLKGVLGSDFAFQKFNVRVDDRTPLAPFGYTYWVLGAGKTWGTVPYPLLEIHPGNETYFYDYAAFNLMNYFEFVSDYYFSAFATHHFDGFFFDKVPLLRKLKWREVAQVKAVWGTLDDDNIELIASDELFFGLNKKPYVEVGAGVENILKILRLDFIWRMSYLENPNIAQFGLRGSFQLTF
jgi:hypothetical protein